MLESRDVFVLCTLPYQVFSSFLISFKYSLFPGFSQLCVFLRPVSTLNFPPCQIGFSLEVHLSIIHVLLILSKLDNKHWFDLSPFYPSLLFFLLLIFILFQICT